MEDVIDDLKIEIVGDSYTAEKSIDKVISLLKEIDSVTSRINKSISEPLKPIEALQKTIDSIKSVDKLRDIGEAISSLNGIKVSKTIAKEITNIGDAVRGIQDLDTGKLNDISNAVSNISAARMPQVETQNTIPATALNVSDISQGNVNFDGVTESADAASVAIAQVSERASEAGENVASAADTATKKTISATGLLKKLGKAFDPITSKVRNLFTTIKKRITYRALNGIISAITGGFKEGVQNVYAYSQMMGTSFAKSMDSLATSYLYLKNSIGAAAAPIITMLVPFVEKAIDKFVELLNAINMVFSRLSGSNEWTHAVKYPTTFADGMGKATKAAKELKKTLLGIDEIHKLDDNSTSATASGVSSTAAKYQFVTDELDVKRADELVKKFKLILGIAGGIGLAIAAWKITSSVVNFFGLLSQIKGTNTTATQVGDAGTSALNGKLKSIAKDLAWGLVIIAEVAVAAGLVVGAVWGLGVMLEQVGKAWEPVIANGKTVAIAMGIGVGVLAAVGAVTALLGSVGTPLVAYLGLGIAMLALIGVSTGLFIVEIWAIGKGLDEIGNAWAPVLENGETIAKGISLGTALLIGIGVVTAALGAATVASVGLLPVAIGLGTGLLVELSGAVVAFTIELVIVAKSLGDELYPALRDLNGKLPSLSKDMSSFTEFMKDFAQKVVDYSKSSLLAGFASTVDTIIGFFLKDPIESMAKDVNKQRTQTVKLNDKLREANPELGIAISLMGEYYTLLERIETLTGKSNNISLANGMFVNMKEVGKNLVTGLVAGISSKNSELAQAIKSVLKDSLSSNVANSYGYNFGKNLGTAVANGFKSARFPTLKGDINVGSTGSVDLKLKAYASGGFPASGQLFVAREAGPELVGTMGGRSTVVTNQQIVEGVANGVYRGVRDAMAESDGGTPIIVQVVDRAGNVIEEIKAANLRAGRTLIPVDA